MRKDPTAFRERFKKWKETGEYELPKFSEGTEGLIDYATPFLKKHEGIKYRTYLDGNGIPTIGYGFTDSALINKGTITLKEADNRLRFEMRRRIPTVKKLIKNWDNLTKDSQTALLSYYYNYPAGFKDTTKFMKAWNTGNYTEAIRQVDAGMNDKKNRGLRTRRLAEQALLKSDPFLQPRKPQSQLVQQLKAAPVYVEPFKYEEPVRTDYSLTNKAGGILNAWRGAGAPNYGGASFRMPTLEEFMRTGSIMPITYAE